METNWKLIGNEMNIKEKQISEICQSFRLNVLKLTLKEMSEKTNRNLKSLSAFETGRIKNLSYIFNYVDISTPEQKKTLLSKLTKVIGE